MNLSIIYILISVIGGAIGQILLKKGMTSLGPLTLAWNDLFTNLWRIATNPYVFTGLGIYVISVIFWLFALSRVDLSFAYPFASLSYVIMLLASWQLFDEHISPVRLIGTLLVGIGVLVISRS